jgi:hypothetical protein
METRMGIAPATRRGHQLLLITTFLPLCWLGMQVVHELRDAVASGLYRGTDWVPSSASARAAGSPSWMLEPGWKPLQRFPANHDGVGDYAFATSRMSGTVQAAAAFGQAENRPNSG